ncbi:hypothetical protein HYV70_05790 [Candidatus Uhrbacteria bacterium]|nr:hypothetical protein [Candidatus Uhrbacteria bacterium]
MGLDIPEGGRERLSEQSQRAIGFVNCVFTSFESDWRETGKNLPPEIFEKWKNRTTASILAFMLNVKPALFLDMLKDRERVQKYLDDSGKNSFIYQESFIVDRDLVMGRIKEESNIAQELGWKEGMTIDEWLLEANPNGNEKQRGIIGFFLGYPKSAINAYATHQIKNPTLVEIGGALFFTTDATLKEADDVKFLEKKYKTAFQKAGLGKFYREEKI